MLTAERRSTLAASHSPRRDSWGRSKPQPGTPGRNLRGLAQGVRLTRFEIMDSCGRCHHDAAVRNACSHPECIRAVAQSDDETDRRSAPVSKIGPKLVGLNRSPIRFWGEGCTHDSPELLPLLADRRCFRRGKPLPSPGARRRSRSPRAQGRNLLCAVRDLPDHLSVPHGHVQAVRSAMRRSSSPRAVLASETW